MSIRHNGKVIAGATQYHPDLLDWKWADHILNDASWLRADTFSWQSGAVYQAAYQHLVEDYNEARSSEDWTVATQNANLGSNNWQGLACDGTKFVALGQNGYISTSTDGTTWTAATLNANLGSHSWRSLAWDGTKFVALGNAGCISTSTDGTTWTTATQNANLGSRNWYGLAYDGTKFVALGYYGYISTSTDGTTWTTATQNANLGSNAWYGLAYDGTKFVALGYYGYISTSTDGTTWTTATQNANLGSRNWHGLACDGTKFVALGQNGYISTSTDGTTWTAATLNVNLGSNSWRSLAWDGIKFVALGTNGHISVLSVAQTETIAGITIIYYAAADGHKIVLASQESNVAAIYNATGVAWYYIIDRTNQRFKLPRTKFGMTGLRDTVGNYVAPGLPNITGELGMGNHDFALSNGTNTTATGAFAKKTNSYSSRYLQSTTATGTNIGFDFDSSRSSSIYGNSTTVQPPATQMYLYFYVGNFTQTALENTAGLNASLFNNKADIDLNNVPANIGSAAKAYFTQIGMPSTTYDSLTLGASGSSYQAPADGYFYMQNTAITNSPYTRMYSANSIGSFAGFYGAASGIRCFLPVKKGTSATVEYGGTGWSLYFVYAQGAA